MTPDEQIAAIRERHAKMPEGDYTKREPHDDWGLVRRPDGWPFADVAMSIDSSTQAWGGPAPEFVEAKREFVANAVADIAALLRHIATLTAELAAANADRERIAKFIDYHPEPSSIYDLATAVKDFVAGESKACADGERAAIADAIEERAITLRTIGWTDKANELVCVASLIRADAIERGEAKGGGDG